MFRMITIMLFICFQVSILADNNSCFRCHNSPTLSVISYEHGMIKSFYVNRELFNKSNHSNLECTDCHKGDFSKWPHSDVINRNLDCISCHSVNSDFILENPQFAEKIILEPLEGISKEFKQSIHFLRHGEKFNCYGCHNPHIFKKNRKVSKEKIEFDNQMCLNCHQSEFATVIFNEKQMPDISITHEWLPNIDLHLQTVRCVDCHSSYSDDNLSHNIMPKDSAVKNCESCHSQNSILMSKLFKHTHQESRKRMGFINATLLNDAYVIGSTRNKVLDTISIISFGLIFSAIIIHTVFRWKCRNKIKTNNKR